MRCIRKNCKNEAVYHQTFGLLPCPECQKTDGSIPAGRKFQFANISKLHRIQEQRDEFGKDLLQPYEGNRANVDFFKANPDRVEEYGVAEELAKV